MRIIGLFAATAALSACATITRGTNEVFVIETDPIGAAVSLSNGLYCPSTPCSIKVPRKGAFVATIEKEGYETAVVNVETEVAGAGAAGMAGNVLVGGIIGAGVDAGTGAMLNHKPNPLILTLTPTEEGAAVEVELQPDDEADMDSMEGAEDDAASPAS